LEHSRDIAEATRAPIYIVHLSSERALRVAEEAEARGLPVYVETRPMYLHLTQERFLQPDAGSQRILEYDEQIQNIGKSRYPEIELLKQITLLSMVNAQS
jgi:hypothetical protein